MTETDIEAPRKKRTIGNRCRQRRPSGSHVLASSAGNLKCERRDLSQIYSTGGTQTDLIHPHHWRHTMCIYIHCTEGSAHHASTCKALLAHRPCVYSHSTASTHHVHLIHNTAGTCPAFIFTTLLANKPHIYIHSTAGMHHTSTFIARQVHRPCIYIHDSVDIFEKKVLFIL